MSVFLLIFTLHFAWIQCGMGLPGSNSLQVNPHECCPASIPWSIMYSANVVGPSVISSLALNMNSASAPFIFSTSRLFTHFCPPSSHKCFLMSPPYGPQCALLRFEQLSAV
eukprot:6173219-Pleurochrysis_carterae.AAC.1